MTRTIAVIVLLLSAAAVAQEPPPGPSWREEAMTPDEDCALARVLDAPFGLIMSDSPVSRSRKLEVDDVGQARRSIDALDDGRVAGGHRRPADGLIR